MQVRRSTTLVLIREHVAGSAVISPLNVTPHVAGALVAALRDRTNGHAHSGVHQQTVSEAKEVWRYEGNPN